MKRAGARGSVGGFTLTELLVVLAILGLLATAGVATWKEAVDAARTTAATNQFLSHLHLARNEAIKRNARVVLCKSSNGSTCTGLGEWSQGWILFQDADSNGQPDAGSSLILASGPLAGEIRLVGNLHVAKYVSYTSTGSTRLLGGGFQSGTLTVCRRSTSATAGRQIVVNAVGRPRVTRTVLSSCY